jgi:hypothetical protein
MAGRSGYGRLNSVRIRSMSRSRVCGRYGQSRVCGGGQPRRSLCRGRVLVGQSIARGARLVNSRLLSCLLSWLLSWQGMLLRSGGCERSAKDVGLQNK